MSTLSIKVGDRIIDLSSPVVMGILNVTPDSFSDGGLLRSAVAGEVFHVSVDKALRRAQSMVEAGASIIDVGGESTRPGARRISEQEELDRVLPVVEALRKNLDVAVSVDTSQPGVIRAALVAGAGLINDVRALQQVGAMEAVAADSAVSVCLMHMRGQPETMQREVVYEDVLTEVFAFLEERIRACEQSGIDKSRIIVDPGFGFGKTPRHNYQLLGRLDSFTKLGVPLLIGVSRKSMLGAATGRDVDARLAAAIAATMYGLLHGARIIRTHDVAETMDAISIQRAISGALLIQD